MAGALLGLFLLGLFLAFHVAKAFYRLFVHPLASVPGYKIAAVTPWYEFFWDSLMLGQYMFKIDDMHAKYGPIVRVNPREAHINDPAYWDVLFSNGLKIDKDAWYYDFGGGNTSAFATVSHDLHRRRRGSFSKFFSAVNVAKLEPRVQVKLKKLLDRMAELGQADQPVDLSNAFRSLTMDVISVFTELRPRDNLGSPDFAKALHRCIRTSAANIVWQRSIPVVAILNAIPRFVWSFVDPIVNVLLQKRDELEEQARSVIASGGKPGPERSPTVLDIIYTSEMLPPEEKTSARIAHEADMILAAGTETTGNTLSCMMYHVHTNPKVLQRLRSELLSCSQLPRDEMIDFRTLSDLPYLQAVVTESLRIACPVSGRLVRVNPRQTMTYTTPEPDSKTYVFPPGTVLSMSMRDLHANPSIFRNPKEFQPERWLPLTDPMCTSTPEERRLMDKYCLPFSKGTRNCVGMELAKQELVLTAGNMFRRFDMELFETTARDIEVAHDYFAPFAPADSEGVRVKVKR